MNKTQIVYEDNDIIVVNKPAGLIVNKADTTINQITLQDFLQENYPLSTNDGSDFYKRNGIVHRIDKETSGLLIVAKNIESFINLQAQFKERRVNKTYIALVHGHVESEEGDISVPVGRLPWNRKRFGVLAGGKEATTHYKVLQQFSKPFTLLELSPKTGRTHQIRVHLQYFNHPIFGDLLYAGRKTSREDRKILERFFLHAEKISFYHPKTGKLVEFLAPLPLELKNIVNLIEG